MTGRRLLAETLVDIGIGALDPAALPPGLVVREVAVTLPVEIAIRGAGDSIDLVGDVPRMVTRTRFDSEPARVAVVWRCGAS
jgi:hypothetical protein